MISTVISVWCWFMARGKIISRLYAGVLFRRAARGRQLILCVPYIIRLPLPPSPNSIVHSLYIRNLCEDNSNEPTIKRPHTASITIPMSQTIGRVKQNPFHPPSNPTKLTISNRPAWPTPAPGTMFPSLTRSPPRSAG